MSKNFQRILVTGVILFGLWINAILSLAAELTVTVDSAKIRKEASTSSEAVGSAVKGKKLTSEDETTDSDGYVWYKVAVEGNTYGYIRSDLVGKTGGSASTGSSQASAPAETQPEAIAEQQASISRSSANIRKGASTKHGTVVSLPKGTEITLIGTARDSVGKLWYQMKCTYNNKEVTGYVREDLITVIESAESGEGDGATDPAMTDDPEAAEGDEEYQNAEEPESSGMEYEIHYDQNDIGGYEYYLYDRTANTKQKLAGLFEAVSTAQANEEIYKKQINNQKVIIIILAVIIILLFLVATVLLFKIRDLYDEYDEEEEYMHKRTGGRRPVSPAAGAFRGGHKKADYPKDTQRPPRRPQEPRPPQSGQGQASRQEPEARKPQRSGNPELRAAERTEQAEETERRGNTASRPANRSTNKPVSARKPQNFLNEDDEFEFEFLNMDDKDL